MISTGENAVRAGGSLLRRVRSALDPLTTLPAHRGQADSGWLAVTILCEPQDIDRDNLPEPLAELGDRIEARVHAAAGDKGTELRVRLRESSPGPAPGRFSGTDSQSDLRSALRRAKQLIEVGEVLKVDPTPHGERASTPGGLLLEAWTRTAPKAGLR
jgi:hypothetical protein|nr:uncharacterized protein [Aeromicrobium sp.]